MNYYDDDDTDFDIHDPKHRIVGDDLYSLLYERELHKEQDRKALRMIFSFLGLLLVGAIIACAS